MKREKLRVSLEKEPGLKGYLRAWTVGSRSVGSGRNGARDLILGVHTDRTVQGDWAHGTRRRRRRETFPRRSFGRTSPEMADLGRPGLVLDEVWPGREYVRLRIRLGKRGGGLGLGRGLRQCMAAQSNSDEENYMEQRGKRRGNGHDMFLTSARSCGGVQKSRIGGAEVESRRRRGGLTALLHEKFPCARG